MNCRSAFTSLWVLIWSIHFPPSTFTVTPTPKVPKILKIDVSANNKPLPVTVWCHFLLILFTQAVSSHLRSQLNHRPPAYKANEFHHNLNTCFKIEYDLFALFRYWVRWEHHRYRQCRKSAPEHRPYASQTFQILFSRNYYFSFAQSNF